MDILSYLLHRFAPAWQGGEKEDAHSFHHFRMEVPPAEAFEPSNSTVAVLSILQIVLSHCQPSQNRWESAIQSGDANQFGFAEAIRKKTSSQYLMLRLSRQWGVQEWSSAHLHSDSCSIFSLFYAVYHVSSFMQLFATHSPDATQSTMSSTHHAVFLQEYKEKPLIFSEYFGRGKKKYFQRKLSFCLSHVGYYHSKLLPQQVKATAAAEITQKSRWMDTPVSVGMHK